MNGYESTKINKEIHDKINNKSFESTKAKETSGTFALENVEQIENQNKQRN